MTQSIGRRFHKIRLTLGNLVYVVLLMGHAYGETRPAIRYEGSRLLGVERGQALLRVRLEVTNPGKQAIPVEYGRVDLRLGHQPIGHGTLPPTSFPAHRQRAVEVPVELSLSRLGGLLPDLLLRPALPWSAQGYVQLAGPRIPIDEQGEVRSTQVTPLLEQLFREE